MGYELGEEPVPTSSPGLIGKAVGFARAAVRHVAGGMLPASREEKARRLGICEQCVERDPVRDSCRQCGCHLDLKAGWLSERCPIGRWDRSPATAGELLAGLADPIPDPDPDPLPSAWPEDPAVIERHIAALHQLAALEYPLPVKAQGAGIIYIGGGKYWPMICVGIRMARRVTSLPIQVWHMGQAEPVDLRDVAELGGITAHDSTGVYPRPRIVGAWESKTTAMLNCGFRQVLYLDADAYLVADPVELLRMAEVHGFVYWADLPVGYHKIVWQYYGMTERRDIPPVQGGHVAIDLVMSRKLLIVAHWINQHSRYFYRHQYGDQDSWRVSLGITGSQYHCIGDAVWTDPAFVCSLDRPVIVHRCRGKLWGRHDDTFADHLPDERALRSIYNMVLASSPDAESTFESVYRSGIWGPGLISGAGSRGEEASAYMARIAVILNQLGGDQVVDLGSGDGVITRQLVARSVAGIDCVRTHITRLQRECSRVAWHCLDLDRDRELLPTGDVALMKDVAMHWPSALIRDWFHWARACQKWRWVIVTHDCRRAVEGADCELGGHRALARDKMPLSGLGLQHVAYYGHKEILSLECNPPG